MDANLRVRVLVLHDNRLLLFPPTSAHGSDACWTVPGGGLEAGETLTECAAREVREETGIGVTIGDVAFLRERPWVFHHLGQPEQNGLCLEIYFYAVPFGDVTPQAEDGCAALPRWVSLAEAVLMPLWPSELGTFIKALASGAVASGFPCHPAR